MTDRARVKAIFAAAVGAPEADRARLLEELCGDDADVRARVLALLAADGAAGGLLDHQALEAIREDGADVLPRPIRVGPFQLGEELGTGGMGVVYEATQDEPQRTVAVKLIHIGVTNATIVERFRREALALARLEHPGIARVYAAGSAPVVYSNGVEASLPYLAMERVRGERLSAYVRDRNPSARERIELLARIGDAIQYAHQMGVVHRDLKPSNILVGADGRPKVLDFGVASFSDSDEEDGLTMTGNVVGTPAYMSPEQISGDTRVDTRSDVYSLGVLAFEVLAGRPPLEVGSSSLADAARTITEVPPPLLGKVAPEYRGDAELVVAQALAKSPEERYPSMAQFTSDLRHVLANEPITARRPSALYVARKLAARHRGLALAAGLLLATLIGGVIVSSRFALRAEREAVRATTSSRFMESMLLGVTPEQARELDTALLERILDDTVERLDSGELAEHPLIEADLRTTLGATFDRLSNYEKSAHSYGIALELLERALGPLAPEVLDLHADQALTLLQRGDVEGAAILAERLRQRMERIADPPEATRIHLERCLGYLASRRGDREKAVEHFERALENEEYLEGQDTWVLSMRSTLAGSLYDLGDYQRSLEIYTEIIATFRASHGSDHPSLGILLNNMAAVLMEDGRLADAEEATREALRIQRAALPGTHASLGMTLCTLGRTLRRLGNTEESLECLEEALAILAATLSAENRLLGTLRLELGLALHDAERFDEAREVVDEALAFAAPESEERAQLQSLRAELGGAYSPDPSAGQSAR